MSKEIEQYEAKTRLPELLRQVKGGKRFTITNRGKAIADLVPIRISASKDKVAAVEKFRPFIRSNRIGKRAAVRALIDSSP